MSEFKTQVVNVRCDPFGDGNGTDVYVGRPSIWGNPYIIGKHGSRAEVIAWYRDYVRSNSFLMSQLPSLMGKRLGCHCAPMPCHADALVELIDELRESEKAA